LHYYDAQTPPELPGKDDNSMKSGSVQRSDKKIVHPMAVKKEESRAVFAAGVQSRT
jgi:hypothetical protein